MKGSITYKRLGDYIREVDVRNTDLNVNKLVGLTIAKAFIPSVANTIGTDLSKYKIIKENQFACSLMQVSRDGKMPIAIYKGENAIMSPAYPVFEICNNELLPDYLHMWFSRSEFDREAVFYAVGGVRGSLDWDDFMDMQLPVPSIEEQRRIVARYQAIQNRIANNKQTIAKLEEAAQALYRKMFVDDVDVENLPEGWRMGTLGEVAESLYGYTEIATMECIGPKFLRITDIVGNSINWKTVPFCKINDNDKSKYAVKKGDILISRTGANIGWAKQIRDNSKDAVYASFLVRFRPNDENFVYYLGLIVESDNYKKYISDNQTGSAQPQANAKIMESYPLLIPTNESMIIFNNHYSPLYDMITLKQQENEYLTEMLSLLMVGMGR